MASRILSNASRLSSLLRSNSKVCTPGVLGTSVQFRGFAEGEKDSKSDGSDFNEEKASEKEVALKLALEEISTSFGKEAIMWLGRGNGHRFVPVVSTGSLALDMALGIGGLPKGRVVEIYGPERSGKTTLALHVIAEAQKSGGSCVFVDADRALDPTLAEAIGARIENVVLPDCGEQAFALVDELIKDRAVDVIVVDSVAALVPRCEPDEEVDDAHIALQARLMSQALRKLSHSLSLSQTILIFINQVQEKSKTFGGFGETNEITFDCEVGEDASSFSGGNALKFYASVRLNVKRLGLIKKGEEAVGSQIQVKVVKNKHAPPFKTALLELEFSKGMCRESEILEFACKHKFISRNGVLYTINDQEIHGTEKAKLYLKENEDVKEDIQAKLREKFFSRDVDEGKGDLDDSPRTFQVVLPSFSFEDQLIKQPL